MSVYYVYILTNRYHTVLYIGVTNNLQRRLYEHKSKLIAGFTAQYNLDKLIYFEETGQIQDAIAREKQLKNWHRDWKIGLIEKANPYWHDLSEGWF